MIKPIVTEKLIQPSAYIVLPKSAMDMSLPFDDMESVDENGVGQGVYYSFNDVVNGLGSLLQPIDVLDGNYVLIRYGFDEDTLPQVKGFLEASGLVNMRALVNGYLPTPSELDYSSLVGNEYMIVPPHLIGEIPRAIAVEEAL